MTVTGTTTVGTGSGTRADLACQIAIGLLVAATWLAGLNPSVHWGDDWAGYLLQAQALVDGRIGAELATNTLAMDGSDVQIGPYAYPWGYPIILAAAGAPTDWSVFAMKAPGGLALLLLAFATWSLCRTYVGRGIAAIATLAVTLQPAVVLDANYFGSDVPFTAVSALVLAITLRQLSRVEAGHPPGASLLLAAAVLSTVAFAIRSNGAVLPCTYLFGVGLLALRGRLPWATAVRHGLAFGAATGALVGLYFAVLPDGSLVHASYLSADPRVWATRAASHVHAIASWTTANAFLGPAKLLPLAALLAVLGWGALRRPWVSLVAAAYLGLHLLLLTAFPFDGGQRYYHPLLPAAALLLAFGLEGVRDRLRGISPRMLAAAAWGIPALLATLMLLKIRADQERFADPGIEAPYAASTRAALDYVDAHAPADARIAFFRPRAFRLLTGRLACAINQPQNLDRVDWYVFNAGTSDPRTQIAEAALRDHGAFDVRYDRPPYRIYVRRPASSDRRQ